MNNKLPISVLASGGGSNLQNIINHTKKKDFPAQIQCVISDRKDSYGLVRAKEAGIKAYFINREKFKSKSHFESEINEILIHHNVDLVCLAGFMRILGAPFVYQWHNRIINAHPSLLPMFKGMNAPEQAIKAGVKVSGCSIHYVRPAIDDGPIIAQGVVPVNQGDNPESLHSRIKQAEYYYYPKVIKLIAENKIEVVDEKVYYNDNLLHNYTFNYPSEIMNVSVNGVGN